MPSTALLVNFHIMSTVIADVWCMTIIMKSYPYMPLRGDDATLKCTFNSNQSELFSLKWFKDGEEFYRCNPKEVEPVHLYKTTGVNINYTVTAEHKNICMDFTKVNSTSSIRLFNISNDTAGVYVCEISEESPLFRTKSSSLFLDVCRLPNVKPSIKGIKIAYKLSALIKINCSSGPSHPAANITWTVNGQKATDKYLIDYPSTLHKKDDNLRTKTSGLVYPAANADNFDNNGIITITCYSSILNYYKDAITERIYIDAVDVGNSRRNCEQNDFSLTDRRTFKNHQNVSRLRRTSSSTNSIVITPISQVVYAILLLLLIN